MRLQGLVLAGGEGSRLAQDGVDTPKALARIGGVPLAQRAIDGLRAAGCEAVTVALRDASASWMASRGADRLVGADTVRCATPSSLHTLVEGLRSVAPGPVLCTMVDSVMAPADWAPVGTALTAILQSGASTVVVTTPATADDAPLYVSIDAAGRVTGFPTAAPTPPLVTAGIYLFGEVARRHTTVVLARGTERMRGLLRSLVVDGFQVGHLQVDRVIDVDHASDLARAESWLGTKGTLLTH